ncbi:hypothetical protein PUNSTDRAFT_144429 [Punctularia strigosozonata HHB-11173 SS5]|uniref:uncharacterized protein n=1 Tax=Punctularia strigosozonata (strain HHB-11173) TaxID=741275 RepID=UPI00044184E7|nr:uncharacterized protein PUNSTDRAFT_144429 [Punctularia strigosozonata HHB-11173 SS5]EIN07950.1 hypothetical protein PUNSTDRAFT_144429 [Punctularia strigosozonata HHB-11173 SS5]
MALSTLPTEIWHHILAVATAVPGALDVGPRDPFHAPPRLPFFDEQNALQDSLKIKGSLSRVCKVWRALVEPYLYEAIVIGPRGASTLPSLAAALLKSKKQAEQRASSETCPLGNWTRRLDLRMHEHRAIELGSLASVVGCLPNLSILAVYVTEPIYAHVQMPRNVVEALIQTCASSLQIIHCCSDRLHFSRADWKELLAASPSLRHIHHETFAPPTLREDAQSITLRSSWAEPPANWVHIASSFKDLHYLRYISAYEDDLSLRTALLLFGRSLRILELDRYSNATSSNPVFGLQNVSDLCPALEKLTLQFLAWEETAELERLPKTVTHLGVRCYSWSTTGEQYADLFETLRYVDAESLREIWFLDDARSYDLRVRYPGALRVGLGVCEERTWELKDSVGNPFTLGDIRIHH